MSRVRLSPAAHGLLQRLEHSTIDGNNGREGTRELLDRGLAAFMRNPETVQGWGRVGWQLCITGKGAAVAQQTRGDSDVWCARWGAAMRSIAVSLASTITDREWQRLQPDAHRAEVKRLIRRYEGARARMHAAMIRVSEDAAA